MQRNILHIILTLSITLVSPLVGQVLVTSDQSAALKTIRSVADIPVVYESEIKGGFHQYGDDPWNIIPLERITRGMFSVNNVSNSIYRYIGSDFTNKVANHNVETDWEEVFVITDYVDSYDYNEGAIVVYGNSLYRATVAVTGIVPTNNTSWILLSSDDQKLQSLALYNDSLRLTLEDGGSVAILLDDLDDQQLNRFEIVGDSLFVGLENSDTLAVSLSSLIEEFRVLDKANNIPVATYNSGGTEIVLINADYSLPNASEKLGATLTIKNIKESSSTTNAQVSISTVDNEEIDGDDSGVILFRSYDYITLLSDGTQWFKVAEGGSKIASRSTDDNQEHLDAFYWGNPDEDLSWRMVFLKAHNRLVVQRRQGGVWKNKASFVP